MASRKKTAKPSAPTTASRKPRGLTPAAAPPPVSAASLNLPSLQTAEWRFVVFTDLHVGAKTIDRALALLERVRETAKHYQCPAVCIGDFWDQRAALAVRHLDLVQREFEKWGEEGVQLIIVPGNHDQVSMDGEVNAVRIFDAFPHITVATEPYADPERKLAFMPWREEPEKQAEMFEALPGDGWTIFAHVEVKGALANSGKASAGRVTVEQIEAHARACYCGHYHGRQKLGDRTWYIGSPFEMNFGERDEPHGIAIVDSENVEPCFLDLDDFPKHHRFTWPDDGPKLASARSQDIVELYFKPDDLGGPALRQALGNVKARDVRPLPLAQDASSGAIAPTFALTLAEGVKLYADEHVKAQAALGATVADDEYERIVALGRHYLAQVPDARTIAPLSSHVRILGVHTVNFCALKNSHRFDLRALGPVLIRGRMGIGKTSMCDAITWALFGATTPRKPGDRAGSLRADDVIHDESDETMVRVEVSIDPPDAEKVNVITIERTKKRGQGAKLRLSGIDSIHDLNGIADTQEAVHRIIGLDLDLWRATVYLGQGAVANFVTDADKKRKELLARAFGLAACEPAQKIVREEMKQHEANVTLYTMRENEAQAGLDALARADFAAQAASWEEMKAATLDALVKAGQEAAAQVAQIEPHLVNEAAWLERRTAYDAHISTLTKSLAAGPAGAEQQRKLATDLGAAEAELGIVQRDVARMKTDVQNMMQARDAGQVLTCKACGQPLPGNDLDSHIEEHELRIASKQQEVDQMNARVLNLRAQVDALKLGVPENAALVTQLEEARAAHAKCSEALAAIARMKEAKASAERRVAELRAQWTAKSAETNPFVEKAREVETARESYRTALADAQAKLAEARATLAALRVWEDGFGAKGVPVLVLRTVLYELEMHANAALASMLSGRIFTRLAMDGDDLALKFYEYKPDKGTHVERTFYQLSGGQRRCVELAFSPFALSEMIFARCGVRVRLLVVDELTTHLDPDTKPLLCNLLRALDRESVLVIDHDQGVQGEFDVAFEAGLAADGSFTLKRAT